MRPTPEEEEDQSSSGCKRTTHAWRRSVLKRLIAVTDRACDRGAHMLSPLYSAINSRRPQCVELLLTEGFSPDAQGCAHRPDLGSPLAFALSSPPSQPRRESVRLLVSAGATLEEDSWFYALASDKTDLLELILEHRRIPAPRTAIGSHPESSASSPAERAVLGQREVRELLCVALSQARFAACWLPPLLKAGLQPSLLLHPHMLKEADSEALNYLLRFVNWSTLSAPLKLILHQRREEKSWDPCPDFDSVPSLTHTCRLLFRSLLGPDQLMRTGVVQRLPVPSSLHDFLQFKDIPDAAFLHPPPSPLLKRLEVFHSAHQHRHVL